MTNNNEKIHDVAIVGCGPAGLSAAINVKIRNLDFILLGVEFCTPKVYKAEEVNNYLGFHKISGEELRENFLDHVKEMGIEIKNSKVDNIYFQGDYYTLVSRDKTYNAYSIILAVGVSNAKYLPGEEDLLGSGVSYCATCDGALYRGKDVAIVTYTDEGIEEAEYLAELVNNVYFIPQFDFDGEFEYDNIKIINDRVEKINGDMKVENLDLSKLSLDVDGVFIYREVIPPDKLLFGLEIEDGHIKVNTQMETNLPGAFAAGDCTGIPYQLSRATGQGQIAGLNAATFARKKKKEIEKDN
ncbi:MAG: NAD(P)/FAD-dependent oxidoreductase [Bacillota bacterium]